MRTFTDLIDLGNFDEAREYLVFILSELSEEDLEDYVCMQNIYDAEEVMKLVGAIQNDITLLMLSLEKPGITSSTVYKKFLEFEEKISQFTEFHEQNILHGSYQEISSLIELKGVEILEFDDLDFMNHCTFPDNNDANLVDIPDKGFITYSGMGNVTDSDWKRYLDPEKYSEFYKKNFLDTLAEDDSSNCGITILMFTEEEEKIISKL